MMAAGCGKTNGGGQTAQPGQPGTESGWREDVDTSELANAVAAELLDSYWPDMDIPEDMLEETYGVKKELYEQVTAQMPMISANVDTLIIVKAKKGQEGALLQALQDYREHNVTQTMQYPANIGKVQAAQIKNFGRYVCFVQLGGDISEQTENDADVEASDAAVIEHCLNENGRALKVIEDKLTR